MQARAAIADAHVARPRCDRRQRSLPESHRARNQPNESSPANRDRFIRRRIAQRRIQPLAKVIADLADVARGSCDSANESAARHGSAVSKRLFVAIDLPESVTSIIAEMNPHIRGVRWLRAEQIHLTVSFLGYVGPLTEETLRENLTAIHFVPFFMPIVGVG